MAGCPCRLFKAWTTGLVFVLLACSTVPVTGRRSLNILPDSQLLSMSFDQYNEVLQKSKLSRDPVKVQMVKRDGKLLQGKRIGVRDK
jgi:hypothetical protein